MKVDGGIPSVGIGEIARVAKELEDVGYDGGITAEMTHDPFLPLAIASPTASGSGCTTATSSR